MQQPTPSSRRYRVVLASAVAALCLSAGGCAEYVMPGPYGPAYAYGPVPREAAVPPVYSREQMEPEYRAVPAMPAYPDYRVYPRPEAGAPCGPGLTAGRVVGGVAGGLLGSLVGHGNGRIAAAAAGAVIGSSMGGC